ncbi:MAG: ribonuclease HII [Bdellovibrionota bacterium]
MKTMKLPNYKIELQHLAQGYNFVAGIDEVGRGCLAGPVVAAVVALDPRAITGKRDTWHRGVRDSKLLSPEKRVILEPLIKRHSLGWGIGVVTPKFIDELNIHHATLLAMSKAGKSFIKVLERFDAHGTSVSVQLLVDGRFTIPNLSNLAINIEQTAIVDGDASVLSISAASILAKTYRDRLMVKLGQKFPRYEFARHKGYGTEVHRQAIQKYGLTSVHRVSFCAKI